MLPHVFCCGVPIALSIISLITPEAAHLSLIPEWLEPWMFVFSAGMLGLSWIMVIGDCHCHCAHCDGPSPHKRQKVILGVITVVFVISILLHILAHN